MAHDLAVEPLLMVGRRHLVDVVDIHAEDDGGRPDIAEQGNLATLLFGKRLLGPAQQDIRLNADGLKFLDRMLRRFCFQLSRRGNIGDQRDMEEAGPLAPEFVAKLAYRFEKRKRFDVTHRAADLADDEILVFVVGKHEVLDGIGHVRNDLDRRAEIIAAALARQDVGIDAPGRDIVSPSRMNTGKALVMT